MSTSPAAHSTEISTHDEDSLPTLAATLPAGTAVYVAHTPKAKLSDVVATAIKLQQLAPPGLALHRGPSRRKPLLLQTALQQNHGHGIEQALLVAGDLEKPAGPYTSTLDIIELRSFVPLESEAARCRRAPGGSQKQVADDVLLAALRHKQAFAAKTGLKLHIATQFTFDVDAIIAWDERLTKEGIYASRRISASQVPRRYPSSSSTPWRAAWEPRWAR